MLYTIVVNFLVMQSGRPLVKCLPRFFHSVFFIFYCNMLTPAQICMHKYTTSSNSQLTSLTQTAPQRKFIFQHVDVGLTTFQ